MTSKFTDLTEGKRADVAADFVTRRTVDCGETRVQRLLVRDRTGREFAVLSPADNPELAGLKTGETYRFTRLLGAAPVDGADEYEGDCPHCGGDVRRGGVADAVQQSLGAAARALDLDDPFGIVDRRTSIRKADGRATGDGVDDWRPMDVGRSGAGAHAPTPSEYVCEDCGRSVDPRHVELGRAEPELAEDFADASGANASTMDAAPSAAPANETVGLATGGAKDVTSFRDNLEAGYTPQPSAITDEGLFYDYHFETGNPVDSGALFAPRYATAVSDHPLDGDTERYLSVGLDSTLSVGDFERPRLDLVVVLDVSGSMDSPFADYYYDESGERQEAESDGTTKIAAATRSLCALTEQLDERDRLGVVLFNSRAHVAKPLREVGATDMAAIRRHVREIAAGGGTNLADGFEAAVEMLAGADAAAGVERRVIFMTDMMPNTGMTDEGSLAALFADAATDGIHSTFVGMGLDANADLAESLSGVRGANHYFVHSVAEFERRLGEEFDYMVTPLVYDLTLELDAEGYEVAAVHGSPSADAATDRLVHVGTLFPSAKEDGRSRGGVVLVRLEQTAADPEVDLVASWTERGGGEYTERTSADLPSDGESFDHDGVRKAVALSRYARELRQWATDVHDRADSSTGVDDWLFPDERGAHERESVPLVVPERRVDRFERLRTHLVAEMDAIGDETLQQELSLIDTLCERAATVSTGVAE